MPRHLPLDGARLYGFQLDLPIGVHPRSLTSCLECSWPGIPMYIPIGVSIRSQTSHVSSARMCMVIGPVRLRRFTELRLKGAFDFGYSNKLLFYV